MFASGINILRTNLAGISTAEFRRLYRKRHQIDFKDISRRITAVFLEISDSDRSADSLAALFYTQCMHEPINEADSRLEDGCRLKVPVRIILDDFATNVRIENFDNLASVVRSRDIYLSVIVQNLTQLDRLYGREGARTIINNFDTWLYLGGSDIDTVQTISRRSNLPFYKVMDLPVDCSIVMFRGGITKICQKYDIRQRPFMEHSRLSGIHSFAEAPLGDYFQLINQPDKRKAYLTLQKLTECSMFDIFAETAGKVSRLPGNGIRQTGIMCLAQPVISMFENLFQPGFAVQLKRAHAQQAEAETQENERYVYFRKVPLEVLRMKAGEKSAQAQGETHFTNDYRIRANRFLERRFVWESTVMKTICCYADNICQDEVKADFPGSVPHRFLNCLQRRILSKNRIFLLKICGGRR